jgi:hypothetical protein
VRVESACGAWAGNYRFVTSLDEVRIVLPDRVHASEPREMGRKVLAWEAAPLQEVPGEEGDDDEALISDGGH